jgi:Transposase DNA-binding/Transposase DDE domain
MKLRNDSVSRASGFWMKADLGDRRRTRRLARTAAAIARRPNAPLPAALKTDAAVQGAYRLVNNRRVDFKKLMALQGEITRLRAEEECDDVLVLHDTTDCAFPHLDPAEIGYLNTGKAGFRLHTALVVDAARWRRPIGVVAAEVISRKQPRRTASKRKQSGWDTVGAKDKEFDRWQRVLTAAEERLEAVDNVIHVADRESDSYELMSAAVAMSARFVFRVRVDRRGRDAKESDGPWSTVKAIANRLEGRFEREVPLSARKAKSTPASNAAHPRRHARVARLQFSATRVEVPRPAYLGAAFPETLALNLVHVVEPDPPDGEAPVEWLLYTTEPIRRVKDIERVVDIYRTRWLCEEFHGALKGGCAFEKREFESLHALLNVLVLSFPIACEILALRSGARTDDKRPATEVLSLDELAILRRISHYRLGKNPTVMDALLAVAALGGHLRRNGPPGWKVLSRGMTELNTVVAAEARRAASEAQDL